MVQVNPRKACKTPAGVVSPECRAAERNALILLFGVVLAASVGCLLVNMYAPDLVWLFWVLIVVVLGAAGLLVYLFFAPSPKALA